MTVKPWDRALWGIVFTSDKTLSGPVLVGRVWHHAANVGWAAYPGEPTRPLLFNTRAQARGECRELRQKCAGLPAWKFRPVAVRELVTLR